MVEISVYYVKSKISTITTITTLMYERISSEERNLTINEAAQIAGRSYEGIRAAIRAGRLRAVKRIGRYEIRPEDLEKFVEPVPVFAGIEQEEKK